MSEGEDKTKAKRSIWQHRGRRFITSANVLASVVLAAGVVAMLNYLSYRYYMRWDLSWRGFYSLSGKTVSLLENLDADVDIVAFIQHNHELHEDIANLLREYEYAADALESLGMSIHVVDPDRDLAWTRELAAQYEVQAPNVIVIESGGRRKYLSVTDLMDYDIKLSLSEGKATRQRVAFRGEQAISSAIQSVTQSTRPKVYFLLGHGERDTEDFGRVSGYSSVARLVRRDNVEVQSLVLAEAGKVPDDCSALVIAGPDRQLSRAEVELLAEYLERSGRMFLLVDPAMATGLEPLLQRWGAALGPHVVVGLTLTGRELVVTSYGKHPITQRLKNVTTMFYMPRSILPRKTDSAGDTGADRPRITVLAANTPDGWGETDLSQSPPRFDPSLDLPGPIPVAVAIERGPVEGIDVEIKPTRLVVIGDSDFVSNGSLSSGVGGNRDLFLSALNWLVEREELMAVAPKVPGELRLDMDRDQMRVAFLLVAAAPSALAALVGFAVWQRRRH